MRLDSQVTLQRKLRVLVIAEAANPEWPSVPLVGYNLFKALSKVTDAHLVTQVRNKLALVRSGLVEGKDFTAIDNESVVGPLYRVAARLGGNTGKGWTTTTAFYSLSYYSFEAAVWRQFSSRIIARDFDVVHRVTPLSPTTPSTIAGRLAKAEVPFVIGPLNGGLPWPPGFSDRLRSEGEWLSYVRQLYKLMPAYGSTRRYSSAILIGSHYSFSEMPNSAKAKCVYIPENGFDTARFNKPRSRRARLPLRGAFVGRLVPYKGADLLLRAASEFVKENKLTIDFYGDGPQRSDLESLTDFLRIRHGVVFHGWVDQVQIATTLRDYDFLALPSIREFGGGVVVEAMALGVMPMVANYGGPAELVDESAGIRVMFTDRDSLIGGFRKAIHRVIQDPQLVDKLGQGSLEFASRRLSWQAKANQILAIYKGLV